MKKEVLIGTFFLILSNNPLFAAGTVSLEHNIGVNSVGQEKNYSQSYADLSITDKKEILRWDGVVDFSARAYTSNDQGAIFSLSEAYITKTQGRTSYSVGRKILPWNPNEKTWGLNELNGQRAFNLTETNQEGISGLHFVRQASYSKLHIFASFLHIPQLNPTFTTDKGIIKGKNEWANLPPTRVRFQDNDVPVYYKVIFPEISEIILQPSAGIYNSWESSDNTFYGYATFKPENSIRINATGYYEQFEEERALVTAKPFVNHHVVTGLGWKNEGERVSYGVNVERISPLNGKDDSFVFESLKIEPIYRDETFVTSQLSWNTDRFNVELAHIYLAEGNDVISNAFAKKPRWRNAVGLGTSYSFTDNFNVNVNVKRDLELSDVVIKSQLNYKLSKHTLVSSGVQLIEAPDENSFWAPYRVNDSVFSRISFLY
tara:strand:+ start:7327 stop:8619 length:1293 start_codon:yes stop_codon:yes gene_type:complete